jgi:Undecaprenyl-phosphate galactose phosphotransferase WbaP
MSPQLDQLEQPALISVQDAVALDEGTVALDAREQPYEQHEQSFDFRGLGIFGPYWSQIMLSSLPLLVGDLLALSVTVVTAYGLTNWLSASEPVAFGSLLLLTSVTMPIAFASFGLYPGTGLKNAAEMGKVALASAILFVAIIFAASISGVDKLSLLPLIIAAIALQATVPLFRSVARTLAAKFRWWGQPALIFGRGFAARELYSFYKSHPTLGIRPVAIIDDRFERSEATAAGVESIRQEHNAYWAIISTPLNANSASTVRNYLAAFPYVLIVPEGEGLPHLHHQMFDCGNHPCVPMTNTLLLPLPRLIKSVMDYALIILLTPFLMPLVVMIMLVIKVTSPGPIFYGQERIGKNGRRFRAWKFRTMMVNADAVLQQYLDQDPELRAEWERDHKLKNDPRVSKVGALLRKSSFDELPQLWNVLCGEMSLVGPRPIVAAEISRYGDWFALYEQATPGLTGMWQISGRNNTTYDVRVAHDRDYVLNWSPWLDLYILVRTIKTVVCREGAY